MTRIPGLPEEEIEPRVAAVLEAQREQWGAPLVSYLLYARRPSIFKGVRGMWSALAASGLLDGKLVALVNRRVAAINQCPF